MATYKDLLKLIQQGLSAEEIMLRLDVCPSKLRRMMRSEKLIDQLAVQEELARQIVRHQTASDVQTMMAKMRELALGEKTETARKACLALLTDGFSDGTDRTIPQPNILQEIALDSNASPMDLLGGEEDPELDDDDG